MVTNYFIQHIICTIGGQDSRGFSDVIYLVGIKRTDSNRLIHSLRGGMREVLLVKWRDSGIAREREKIWSTQNCNGRVPLVLKLHELFKTGGLRSAVEILPPRNHFERRKSLSCLFP